jgi:hypothetical protein
MFPLRFSAASGAFLSGQVTHEVEPGVWLTLIPLPGEGYELKKVQFDRQVMRVDVVQEHYL